MVKLTVTQIPGDLGLLIYATSRYHVPNLWKDVARHRSLGAVKGLVRLTFSMDLSFLSCKGYTSCLGNLLAVMLYNKNQNSIKAQSKNILPTYLDSEIENVRSQLLQWANCDQADEALAAVLCPLSDPLSWLESNTIQQMPHLKVLPR